jgi:hypothetical protein
MPQDKTLRIVLAAEATVVWTIDAWAQTNESEAIYFADLNLWSVDLFTAELAAHSQVEFTFFWKREKRWEGRNFCVEVVENAASDESTPAQSTGNVPLNEVPNRSEQRLAPVH